MIYDVLTPIELELNQLYLDPNNPRFIVPDWQSVPNARIAIPDVQSRASERLREAYDIEKLIFSIESNGYLPIDRIIVKRFADDRYVVLEGNRRICAAKEISARISGQNQYEDLAESLRVIPCLLYTGTDDDAAWIFQGLRHISGIMEWSSYSKAKLLVDRMESENLNYAEVGKRFGLTAYGAGQWARGYFAFMQAKEESDVSQYVDERAYPYFQELFGRSSIAVREWLQWNDDEKKFTNDLNFNEFLTWIYSKDGEDENSRPNFDNRVLKTRDDLRKVATLIREHRAYFEEYRQHNDIDRAYSTAIAKQHELADDRDVDPVGKLFQSMERTISALQNVPLRLFRDNEKLPRFNQLKASLAEAIEEASQR